MDSLGVVVLFLLLFFIVLWFAPWVTFWAIAVLFGYSIPLTWGTFWAFWALKLFAFGGLSRVASSK